MSIARDSATGKGIATFIQAGVLVLGIISVNSAAQNFLIQKYPFITTLITVGPGVLSFLNNFFRSDVPNV